MQNEGKGIKGNIKKEERKEWWAEEREGSGRKQGRKKGKEGGRKGGKKLVRKPKNRFKSS